MKNKLIISSVFFILLLSFLAPQILFEMEDLRMEKQIFTQSKTKRKIDVQAQKIYLVKAIHDMSGSSMEIQSQTVVASSNKKVLVEESQSEQEEEKVINQVKNEFLKLEECKILKDMNASFSTTEYNVKNYVNFKKEYEMHYTFLGNKTSEMSLGRESKTGKILFAVFPKDKLQTELERQEILENYVKYLDLYMIGDWKFENNTLKSEKAGLCAMLFIDSNNDNCFLSIQSNKNNTPNYKIVESLE